MSHPPINITSTARFPRLYVSTETFFLPSLKQGDSCPLTAAQAHYLGTVLRRQSGDYVRVFNASVGEWLACIIELRKEKGCLTLERCLRAPNATPSLKLAFALLKRDATDLALRMGTELGVTEFIPTITDRTNTHSLNLKRLTTITIEAAEQCERLDIPTITAPISLTSLLNTWPMQQTLFAAIERLETPYSSQNFALNNKVKKGDGLLIGPEGGLTLRECHLLQQYHFVIPLSLGSYILRADTAVAAGLTLIAHYLRLKDISAE